MKTYTKTHSSKKVAEIHLTKIKDRGGKAEMTSVKGGFKIDYSFPDTKTSVKKSPVKKGAAKKVPQKKTSAKKYDVISPDGFSIRIGVPPFKTPEERNKYFEQWKKRYEQQGYYSSNNGRIPLHELKGRCEWIEL